MTSTESVWSPAQASLIRKWTQAAQEVKGVLEYARAAKQDSTKIDAFRGRYTVLEKYFSKFEALSDSLYESNEDLYTVYSGEAAGGTKFTEFPDSKQTNILSNVRAYYMECHEAHATLTKVELSQTIQNITLSQDQGGGGSSLPKINIPKFSGDFEQWPTFKDTFMSMVHNSPSLSNTQRFHHLIGALTGVAKSVISNFSISDQNYTLAWTALEKCFDNKRVIASCYLNKILDQKPATGKPTNQSYRDFLSNVGDTIAAFQLLKIEDPAQFILFHLAIRSLDSFTREQFELGVKKGEFPTVDALMEFVRSRQLALCLAEPSSKGALSSSDTASKAPNKGQKPKGGNSPKTSLLSNTSGKGQGEAAKSTSAPSKPSKAKEPTPPCAICKEAHGLFFCANFHQMTPRQRFNALKAWRGCRVCLSARHSGTDCKSTLMCCICKQKHHSMLCLQGASAPSDDSASSLAPNPPGTTLTSGNSGIAEPPDVQVVLGTAEAQILDARGQLQTVRLVIDSASQYSYITHRCMLRLGLKMKRTPRKISCLGGTLFEGAQGVLTCELHSQSDKSPSLTTEAVVVRNITNFLPTTPIPAKVKNKFLKFELADPKFFHPAPIDFLAGADVFAEIVSGGISSVGENLPRILETIFGWVVIGKYLDEPNPVQGTSLFSLHSSEGDGCFDLQKFWEVEDIPSVKLHPPHDEDGAELSFKHYHYRLPNGKFGVRLPLVDNVPDLSASEGAARKRFYNLETKFKRDASLRESYVQFMNEYISLGHMEPTSKPSRYMIPHHGVHNKEKLRVVFDGSCKTPNGSLNQHLFIGPPLQNDLRMILINFRAHQIAFVTDAVKMYRQIEISPLDRAFQHIFWRADPSLPLQKFQLNTVTYGLSCSPFLALRCIKQLEHENQAAFPLAAESLNRDLYVDDIATGSQSLSGALELQRQLIAVMKQGGFQLAKWASNAQEILDAVPKDDQTTSPIDLSSNEMPSQKVLGMKWNPNSDTFSYTLAMPADAPATKRGILSTVARIFDPVGFLSPTTILFKILIQELWLAGVQWDQKVSAQLEAKWQSLIQKLTALAQLHIPRCVSASGTYTFQLVGFSDASSAAYCAAVYIRLIQGDMITVKLLTAKTKVAPTKPLTIPKLELCGALLLARLLSTLNPFHQAMDAKQLPPVYFTDSAVTLAWVTKTPTSRLKVFVANRVAEIQQLTSVEAWHHVAGSDNPTDVGSRGIPPEELPTHQLWWTGPPWLSLPMEAWPRSNVDYPVDLPEVKTEKIKVNSLLSCSALPLLIDWMARFSSYRRLIRVTALILRVIHNRKHKTAKRTGSYLLQEIVQAFVTCVRLVQLYSFFNGDLATFPRVENTYKSLTPFLDDRGILRVGGRLRNANLSEDHKHQILLPHNSHFTILLIDFCHRAYMHCGPMLLQAQLQTRIWVPALRRLVHQRTRKCLKCFKLRASAVIPRMGDLPAYRLKQGRAFLHVGVDFAGPFDLKESNRRKAPVSKVYLCLFVCMVTKALHLEAVTSLSTEAFLAAFSRFISRRGRPSDVYSDNGTNFAGGHRELKALEQWYNEEQTKNDIYDFTAPLEINWHFNPPYSPHFGGLWEAGVKSVKRHLYLVAGDTPLTYEEISTLFASIESVLNSRPICPLSDDPHESDYLSPGHFLIGQPLLATSEPTLLDTRLNLLSRWQLVKRMSEEVWARWRVEYLSTLQKRAKWHRNPEFGLQPGDLVLLKTKEAPPLRWPTGKILEVHTGSDGQVRVVTIRTPTSTYKRSTANLIPLLPLRGQSADE